MKRKILAILMVFLGVLKGISQNKEKITLIEKSEVPELLIDAVTTQYPTMEMTAWYSIPTLIDFSDWEVEFDQQELSDQHKPDNYSVMLRGEHYKKYIVFDKDGNVLRVKEIIEDKALPKSIRKQLKKGAYKDWKIVGDKEKIIIGENNRELYYKIKLKKDQETHALYFDLEGNKYHLRTAK